MPGRYAPCHPDDDNLEKVGTSYRYLDPYVRLWSGSASPSIARPIDNNANGLACAGNGIDGEVAMLSPQLLTMIVRSHEHA